MSKKDYQKITLAGLIAKAEQKKAEKSKGKTGEFYVKSLDGTVTLKGVDTGIMADAGKMENDEGNAYIVYQCCIDPPLKDKELQEAYGCGVPTDIVEKLFEAGEIAALSVEAAKLSGYFVESVKPVDVVKN